MISILTISGMIQLGPLDVKYNDMVEPNKYIKVT